MLANETIATRRAVLSDELSLHDDMIETLRENKTRNVEAQALKEFRTQQLEKLIDIMLVGQSGTPEVTNAQIRNVHLKLKLSPKTIEDTYVKKGFVVQQVTKAVNLNDAFLTPVVAGNISSKIFSFKQCLFRNILGRQKCQICMTWRVISVEEVIVILEVITKKEQQNYIASWSLNCAVCERHEYTRSSISRFVYSWNNSSF